MLVEIQLKSILLRRSIKYDLLYECTNSKSSLRFHFFLQGKQWHSTSTLIDKFHKRDTKNVKNAFFIFVCLFVGV